MDTLAAGERELARLLELKKARLGVLIEETRGQVGGFVDFALVVLSGGGRCTMEEGAVIRLVHALSPQS